MIFDQQANLEGVGVVQTSPEYSFANPPRELVLGPIKEFISVQGAGGPAQVAIGGAASDQSE